MLALNITFQEEYKRLDRLCKDGLSSTEGVTAYIRYMEFASWENRCCIATWDADYRRLKHLRWLRNRLAHEVGVLDSDLCTDKDLEWLLAFYNRILQREDPLSLLRRVEEAKKQRLAYQREIAKRQAKAQHTAIVKPQSPSVRQSFWKRLACCLKTMFRAKK